MSDLPPGWEWTTLGEIAETRLGKMLDKGRSTNQHMVPYLRNVNVQWGRFDLSDVLAMDILPDQRDTYEVRPGDLLVCEGGEIGRCAIWPGSDTYMGYQKALHRLRPYAGIEPRYLRYLLEHLSVSHKLLSYSSGSTIKHLPQQQLRCLPMPLAPTAEQRRIVAALEGYLSRLDVAARGLVTASRRLDGLKGAVRDAALSHWPAARCTLSELVERIEAGKSFGGPTRPAREDEWGIIKVSAMTWGEFRPDENKAVGDEHRVDPRHEVKAGDILVSRANTEQYVGAPVLIRTTRPRLLLSDKSLRLVPKPGINREWLLHVLASPLVRKQISRRATGTKDSMRNISQGALKEICVPLHDERQQRDIVSVLTVQLDAIDRLGAALTRASTTGELLRRVLLSAAFAGHLVQQDPADQPASELLARIRAERAVQPTATLGRRPKNGTRETLL